MESLEHSRMIIRWRTCDEQWTLLNILESRSIGGSGKVCPEFRLLQLLSHLLNRTVESRDSGAFFGQHLFLTDRFRKRDTYATIATINTVAKLSSDMADIRLLPTATWRFTTGGDHVVIGHNIVPTYMVQYIGSSSLASFHQYDLGEHRTTLLGNKTPGYCK